MQTVRESTQGKLYSDEHKAFVDECIRGTPDMSAQVLRTKIADKFNITVSTSGVKRFRHKIGWRQERTKYGQLVRDVNKVKHVEWCQTQLQQGETFDVSIYAKFI